MNEELERLLWQSEDAELSAAERRRLESLLAADPGAASQAQEVKRVAVALAAVPEESPPAELRQSITAALARIPPPRARRQTAANAWSRLPISLPLRAQQLVYLAAGLVLGAFAYHFLHTGAGQRDPVDVRDLYGSMAPRETPPTEPSRRAELAAGAGTLDLRHRGESALEIELWLTERQQADLTLAGGGGLHLAELVPGAGWEGRVEASEGRLEVSGLTAGSNRVVVQLADPHRAVDLVVNAAGTELLRLQLPPDGPVAPPDEPDTNY